MGRDHGAGEPCEKRAESEHAEAALVRYRRILYIREGAPGMGTALLVCRDAVGRLTVCVVFGKALETIPSRRVFFFRSVTLSHHA